MRDLEPWLRGERHDRVVGRTFDDGYRNNLLQALPVLRHNRFTATCYAVSSAWSDWNIRAAAQGVPRAARMDKPDFKQWLSAGMDVGAHTRRHLDLTTLDDATALD